MPTIRQLRATPVRVPARPDSLNSAEIIDQDAAFAKQFHTGAAWTEFPMEPKWIVELETEDGVIGVGETYRGVTEAQVHTALQAVAGADVFHMPWRRLPIDDSRVYDAIESAVLDLAGKHIGAPVAQLLGGAVRHLIECSGWTGRRTYADAARKAEEALQRGHSVFKFKCSTDDPVRAWVDAIQECCGDRIRVLLDPNQRWQDVATTKRLMEGVPASMMFGLEDPIVRSNLQGFRELRETLGIPLFVHIALPYDQDPADAIEAMALDAVDGFNFNGPMFRFVELAATASLRDLPCWHGSEVDLGILEASALHACAAAPGCTIPSDIFGELVREDDLLVNPIEIRKGFAALPQGPGLGIQLDYAALERYRCGPSVAFQG